MTKFWQLAAAAGLGVAVLTAAAPPPAEAPRPTPYDDAMRLLRHAAEDGSINSHERAVIDTLWAAQAPVELDIGAGAEIYQAPDDDARALLGAFRGPLHLDNLWLKDKAQMRLFLEVASVSPDLFDKLRDYAARRFLAKWSRSHFSNGYGPIRQELDRYRNLIGPPGSATFRTGTRMGYDAMKRVDRYVGDRMPDMLYNGMKPPAEKQAS